jgi:DNA processing protein
MNSDALYLFFSYLLGMGPITFDKMLCHYGSLEKAYDAPISEMRSAVGPVLAGKWSALRETLDPQAELHRLNDQGIVVLTRIHPKFPQSLLHIPDPPLCLYVKGNLDYYDFEKDLFVAVVGTRKPTSYGQQLTGKFSRELSQSGCVIVSGMAMGIDAIAHMSALDGGGKTVAFLGCGVNIVYPQINAMLYDRILKENGLIISEFPPDMTVQKGLFISRNRLISGLSRGVLVIEGLHGSGSLITARCALEQGKEVFAPPAPITSLQSQAPNLLLKEGAKLVTDVQDILEEFGQRVSIPLKDVDLTDAEMELLAYLKEESLGSDDLSRSMKKPVSEILSILSSLELQEIVVKSEERGIYEIKI